MNIKIKRTIICMIFFIIAFFALDNVFAKDLVYETKLDASKYLTYANYVKALNQGNGKESELNDDITDNFVSATNYYNTVGLIFHNSYASSYSPSDRKGKDQLVYFDESKYNLDPLSLGLYRDAYTSKVKGGGTYIGNNTSNDILDAILTIDSNNKLDGANSLVNILSRTDNDYFTENRFKIGPNTVKALQNKLKEQNTTRTDGFYKVKFSNIISTGGKNYYTAQAMFNNMGSGWEIRNYGKWHLWSNMTNYNPYSHDGTAINLNTQYSPSQVGTTYWFPAGSVLNEYDNEMLIPVGQERSVYVVHWLFNENGTYERYLPDYQAYNKLPNEVQNDINGEKRHWYGWSEQYSSNDKLEIYNKLDEIRNKKNNFEYRLIGYELYEVNDDGSEGNLVAEGSYDKVGMLQQSEPWISFDASSHNIILGPVNGATTIKNYAVHYKYAKTSASKKVYIGHAYSSKTSGLKYMDLRKSKLNGSESVASATKSSSNVDGWLNEYTFYDAVTIKDPINNNGYKIKGYVKFKYNMKSSFFSAEYVANIIESRKEIPKSGIKISDERTVVIYIYDSSIIPEDGTSENEKDKTPSINVSAWLDYINSSNSVYSGATSKEYNSKGGYNDKIKTTTEIYNEFKKSTGFADIVPSNSELKPYIRTAPFIIQGINIGPISEIKTVKSEPCTITISYSYKTSCTHRDKDGKKLHDYDTKNGSYTKSYTSNIDVEWWKYKVFNLTMAHISDITIKQDETAKLFNDLNKKIALKDDFYQDKVIATEPEIKAYLNYSSIDSDIGYYDSSSKASSAAKLEADELAKSLKIDKLKYTVYDDKIYVNDNYSDILKSSTDTATINNINGASSYEINKENVISGKRYDDIIKSYIKWDTGARLQEMTKYTDFVDNYFKVSNKENGVRELTATLTYTSNNIEGSNTYKPTWYSTSSNALAGDKEITFGNASYEFSLDNADLSYPKVRLVDVYDPIEFKDWNEIVETRSVIDHTLGGGIGAALVLQPNTEFTIKPPFKNVNYSGGSSFNSAINVEKCWVVFDFPVIKDGETIAEGTKIEINIDKETKFRTTDEFKALTNNNINNIRLIAYSKNATDALRFYYNGIKVEVDKNYSKYHKLNLSTMNFIDTTKNDLIAISNTAKENNQNGYITKGVTYSSNHAITTSLQENSGGSKNVFRMYDFAVTDCTDLAYKDVFRKTNINGVNEHTDKVYWSGINKLIIYDENHQNDNNYILPREYYNNEDGIGSSPQRILPLGPYKNTDKTYITAPKLGYRISFDLKTTGNLEDYSKRKIVIIPRYYFLSKSGEYTSPEKIRLYYKNTFGKYVALKGYERKENVTSTNYSDYYSEINGSEFNISFTPNDGYRFLRNTAITPNSNNMTSSKIKLNMSKLELTSKMMTTDEQYIQAWYGEFKLPNSTIAVKIDDKGKCNLNNPLTDGYIGVIFDIYCVNTAGNTLSYSQNNRDVDKNLLQNTSQWDYEGYMGFNSPGNKASVNVQLEKGTWNITNEIYNKIKGTVLLYDADNRASNDYN